MKQVLSTLVSSTEIAPGRHLLWLKAPDIAATALPGQFITAYCKDMPLRRPISIHQVGTSDGIGNPIDVHCTTRDKKPDHIALLFQITGKGTQWLSQRKAGEDLDILGPLGNGFQLETEDKNLLLLAGGIGVAPLIFLAQEALPEHSITLIHGTSTASQIYARSLPSQVRFIPVTEDGTTGRQGKITDVLPDFLSWADRTYACGPLNMYRAISEQFLKITPDKNSAFKCQVSLEVRMGCGIGACYGCTIKTRSGPKRVCREGPVFPLEDIIWEEVKL